jgi:hypothetical protein
VGKGHVAPTEGTDTHEGAAGFAVLLLLVRGVRISEREERRGSIFKGFQDRLLMDAGSGDFFKWVS